MATEENGVAPFPLSAVDQEHLMTTNDDFRYHTWEDLKEIIGKFTHLRALMLSSGRSMFANCNA